MALILQATACGPEPAALEPQPVPRFEEIGAASGLDYTGPSSGLAVGDFDGDGWEDLYSSNHGSPPRLFRNVGGRYADATAHLRGPARGDSHGAAWADYDNDGDPDLLQLNGAQRGQGRGPNRLYVNRGGWLEASPSGLGLADPLGRGRMPLWLDWNLDGRLDVLVSNAARLQAPSLLLVGGRRRFSPLAPPPWEPFDSLHAGLLLLDGGPALLVTASDGTLRLMPAVAGAAAPPAPRRELPAASAWASDDLDGDGHTDLVVVRGAGGPSYRLDGRHRLLASLPTGDDERGLELESSGRLEFSLAPASRRWWQPEDVVIGAAGAHPPAMDFALEPEAAAGLPLPPRGAKSVRIGHDPATGRWRVAVAARDREVLQVIIESAAPIGEVAPLGFLPGAAGYARYLAGPGLEERSAAELESLDACRSLVAGDLDNDRDIDLFVVCSDTLLERPNRLLLNDGTGRFESVADEGGAGGTARGTAEGVVLTDYDRDGWLDIVVANGAGLRPFNDGPLELYRNRGGTGGWLDVVLRGRASSADALGAVVTLTTELDRRVRLRGGEIHAAGQSRAGLHFGLGTARVESLAVAWPSGHRQRFHDLPPNRVVHLIETRSGIEPSEAPHEDREEAEQ